MKVPSAKRVREYEFTYLVPGSYTSAQAKEVQTVVEALLKKHKLTVKNTDEWGKKATAYPIDHAGKKETEAYYLHLLVEGDSEVVQKFTAAIKLNQDVLRSLVVRCYTTRKD